MRRRHTRKQWYEYHLARAQKAAQGEVRAAFNSEVESTRQAQKDAWNAYLAARKNEPFASRVAAFFGSQTDYRRDVLYPLEADVQVANRALQDVLQRERTRLDEAKRQGTETYEQARELRRQEAEARAQRVAQHKEESRLRYLEESPAIRSAAKGLKRHLIKVQSLDGMNVVCFYCESTIPGGEAHLEHKRPISRGGGNSRGNLALSCAACNLRKGRKTHDEFLRELGRSAL